MYMNGIGIKSTTQALTDQLWATVPPAIVGSTAATTAPIIYAVSWFVPHRTELPWWALVIVAVCVVGGVVLSIPFYRAEAALKRHRLAMDTETGKSGRGWASS